MSFAERVRALHREFSRAGWGVLRKPADVSELSKEECIRNCEIIARKDYFNVIYVEVECSWMKIAGGLAKQSRYPCMVITKYRDSHHMVTTVKDHGTHNAKVRHLVLDTKARPRSLVEFIQELKVKKDDDHIAVDAMVQDRIEKRMAYRQAMSEFGDRLVHIIKKTESMIDNAIVDNNAYDNAAKRMLEMCRQVISDKINLDDVKSMLMQHILTYKIFTLVYDDVDFHSTNKVAGSLEELKNTLNISYNEIRYETIELIAESLTDTNDQREFLKKVYETFYKAHDPDRADKDGIVYTPISAINFMVRSTDELLQKHFSKSLSDKGVTILDPATGTGAFIEHILRQIKPDKIKEKYRELHANEISILPYYIAALSIEHTYWELTGEYSEFENICWMDTLDSGVKNYEKLTAYFTDNDNLKRMSRQQDSDIRVAIANPPYNAVQTSLNNANPADKYDHIDKAIQEKYYKSSRVGNKNKSFDMYKRFLRWSSDRIKENGTVVFISNNSFLDAKADEGVRRALYDEFDHIYIVNLKGNARSDGDVRRRECDNIFENRVRVGICISFFVKTGEGCSDLQYTEVKDYAKLDKKIRWLDSYTVSGLSFKTIKPDKNSIWLNQTNNDFEDLALVIPTGSEQSIFDTATLGVATAKDDWVYDLDLDNLKQKIKYYISVYIRSQREYKSARPKPASLIEWVDKKIKWSDKTLEGIQRQIAVTYSKDNIMPTLYRPFVIKHQYYADIVTERSRKFRKIFLNGQKNKLIVFPNPAAGVKFDTTATDIITDLGCVNGSQNIPLWKSGQEDKTSNVTEYGHKLFQTYYKIHKVKGEDVFYYVYAIFNDPKYEETYKYNLRRGLPRIPLAKNFREWVKIGKDLFDLHCNFDKVEPYGLIRKDKEVTKSNTKKLILKLDAKAGKIIVDDVTTLEGVPPEVKKWMLKSKTPLEWVLEFYKESKNKIKPSSSNDENTRKKFSRYKFDDHKEHVVNLLDRITTVCVETVNLHERLKNMEWGPQPSPEFINRPEGFKVRKT